MSRTLLLCLLVSVSAPAMAVYKCESRGKTTYSDTPCVEGKSQELSNRRSSPHRRAIRPKRSDNSRRINAKPGDWRARACGVKQRKKRNVRESPKRMHQRRSNAPHWRCAKNGVMKTPPTRPASLRRRPDATHGAPLKNTNWNAARKSPSSFYDADSITGRSSSTASEINAASTSDTQATAPLMMNIFRNASCTTAAS